MLSPQRQQGMLSTSSNGRRLTKKTYGKTHAARPHNESRTRTTARGIKVQRSCGSAGEPAGCVASHVSSCKSFAACSPCAACAHQCNGMPGDHQPLVGRHDQEEDSALQPRDLRCAVRIGFRIKDGAEPCKLFRDAGADRRRILANAGGKYEGI